MNPGEEGRTDGLLVSERVREFYERHPYPRPVESLEGYRRRWSDPARRRADFHLFWPAEPFREDFSILVAGCGTSQAAKHALRHPSARVTGIDFSETSVRCTEELKRKYGLDNLRVLRLPVERVGELGERFDQVVCTGVLHHLPDPDAGLAALRGVLEPGGAVHLMVYAPYGRTGIYMLQEFCRRLGIGATDEGIRGLAAALGALPPGHPLGHLLREAPDFREEGALADALLHPRDRAYPVPELFRFLERGGLAFGRWVRQAPYSPRCGVLRRIPQAPLLSELPPEGQYAAAELFRGTMVRHSLVAYRDDGAAARQRIDFSGDEWPSYVPVRSADTVSVEERLPPGAAAVLIHRGHPYTDIWLPIDGAEKGIFDGIDGRRSIAGIAGRDGSASPGGRPPEAARAFFERLWWHDQVVFARR